MCLCICVQCLQSHRGGSDSPDHELPNMGADRWTWFLWKIAVKTRQQWFYSVIPHIWLHAEAKYSFSAFYVFSNDLYSLLVKFPRWFFIDKGRFEVCNIKGFWSLKRHGSFGISRSANIKDFLIITCSWYQVFFITLSLFIDLDFEIIFIASVPYRMQGHPEE